MFVTNFRRRTLGALSALFLASFALVGCSSNEEDTAQPESEIDLWGESDTSGDDGDIGSGEKPSHAEVAKVCERAVARELDSVNYTYSLVTVPAEGVKDYNYTSLGYDGQLKGVLDGSPEGSHDFTVDCRADFDSGSVEVSDITLPTSFDYSDGQRGNFGAAEPPIAREALDPEHDSSGLRGKDDNLGIYYHNSVDWKWLETPGGVMPGGLIFNETKSGNCSTGFLASASNRLFIITAGHCGDRGDQFYVQDAEGNWDYVGEMVESYVDWDAGGGIEGADIGLIEVTGPARYSSSLPVERPLKGWITPQEAQRENMAICRLGATTGYSCGKFEDIGEGGLFYYRGISDRGDSGGAIFAANDSGVWALGVVSNVSDGNKTLGGGMEIGSAIDYWGLKLHG